MTGDALNLRFESSGVQTTKTVSGFGAVIFTEKFGISIASTFGVAYSSTFANHSSSLGVASSIWLRVCHKRTSSCIGPAVVRGG